MSFSISITEMKYPLRSFTDLRPAIIFISHVSLVFLCTENYIFKTFQLQLLEIVYSTKQKNTLFPVVITGNIEKFIYWERT